MNDRDCVALLQWALPRLNHRWEGYRRVRRQVCRRIAERIQILGLADMAAYRKRLEEDPAEWIALRFCLRVTISHFFRNKRVFHALAQTILPALAELGIKSGEETVHTWSAGCASGEEPYSLSILWSFYLQARWPKLRLSILGTDVDAEMLRRARMACYPASSLRDTRRDWVERAFVPNNGRYCLHPELRAPVRFEQQDLCEELADGPFHLILCRNLAFTYFAEPLQQKIAKDLLGRLLPGGCLVLGAHERLPAGSESIAAKDETKDVAAGIYWKCA
jgi:chemotaxis protein methyltransferase CheR